MRQKNKLIANLGEKLHKLLDKAAIDELSRTTGFVQRESSLSGFKFALLNLESIGSNGFCSLSEQCVQLYHHQKVVISKQGLDGRYTEQSTAFLKELFLQLLKIRLCTQLNLKKLSFFKGIYVRDATSSQLPSFFSDLFQGSGGSASKAGLKVDLAYDLKGTDLSLTIRAGANNDSSCEDGAIVAGGLYLQDLGYFKLSRFDRIAQHQAYFISRYKHSTNIYEEKTDQHQIQIKDLVRNMKTNEIRSKVVFFGQKTRLKGRIIIQKVPVAVAEKRRKKLKQGAAKKGQKLSKERLASCDYTLLMTNIMTNKELTDEEILKVYTIRWQIEIIFKCWKSVMKFGQVHKMKAQRFLSMLYGHMIWIVLTMKITQYFKTIAWNHYEIELSELKSFKTMRIFERTILDAIMENSLKEVRKVLEHLFDTVFLFAEKEVKKNKGNQLFNV